MANTIMAYIVQILECSLISEIEHDGVRGGDNERTTRHEAG